MKYRFVNRNNGVPLTRFMRLISVIQMKKLENDLRVQTQLCLIVRIA